MKTAHRIHHLAEAARAFPWLGPVTEEGLRELLRVELGHEEALDRWVPVPAEHRQTRAIAPGTILHIVSGNTPHAALQSLLRGLLLGSRNRCKLPSTGLPEVEAFRARLPAPLAERVELSPHLPDEWLKTADAVIVFGSDATLEAIRARLRPGQPLFPHGHRISFGVVFDDPGLESPLPAAKDASLFNQQGCLSPHLFYVSPAQAEVYAARLAEAMEQLAPPEVSLTLQEAAAIAEVRDSAPFIRGARLWKNDGPPRWTVLYDPRPGFTPSCLNRTVFVKPLPDDLPAAVAPFRPHLSTVGIWPATPENAALAAATGASRVCPIGSMQQPPLTWRQDGMRVLAPLVRWIDFESA